MEQEQDKLEAANDFKAEFLAMIERGVCCENSTAKEILNKILNYR